jgi:hypothetical protein
MFNSNKEMQIMTGKVPTPSHLLFLPMVKATGLKLLSELIRGFVLGEVNDDAYEGPWKSLYVPYFSMLIIQPRED